jgi:hypothetical protein
VYIIKRGIRENVFDPAKVVKERRGDGVVCRILADTGRVCDVARSAWLKIGRVPVVIWGNRS